MEAAVERRDVDENRVPLDSLVELSHEGFAESFEADGVNVSTGGVSMRASYLPSVGARLRCRIPNASSGGPIEAGAEVVWSTDKGPHTGEFGLRFLDIDEASARAIRSMLARGPYLPPRPGGSRGAEDTLDEARPAQTVSLGIDGVADSIRASVVAEDPDLLTVAQELSFLRLATGVTVHRDGRRGRIEGIELMLDGDTPKLLIDILFDQAVGESPAGPAADATIPDFLPAVQELRGAAQASPEASPAEPPPPYDEAVHTAETAVDLSSPPAREIEAAAVEAPVAAAQTVEARAEIAPEPRIVQVREPRIVQATAAAATVLGEGDLDSAATEEDDDEVFAAQEVQGAQEAREVQKAAPAEALAATVPEVAPSALAAENAEADALAVPRGKALAVVATRLMTSTRARVDSLRPRVAGAFAKLGPSVAGLRETFGPRTVALRARVTAFFAMLRAEALPRFTASAQRTGRVLARATNVVRDKVGAKLPVLARREKRRRKTAPPPTDSNVAGRRKTSRRGAVAAPPKKDRRRAVVVSMVALSGVSLAAWALIPGGETAGAADPLGGHQSIVAQSSSPNGAAAPVATTAAPVATTAAPLAAAPAPIVGEPAMPRAVGEGPRQAGPMPAPTFPSLAEGARPQAPQALPEGSPYAVDVREGPAPTAPTGSTTEGAVFGAPDIADGRSFLIRMSQPVTVVRGTARPDGFTVEVPSSLSLDRAGPIAASHPLVERSMILNRGDHSELTISFVAGQSPAYRVSARGSAIEVLIARR